MNLLNTYMKNYMSYVLSSACPIHTLWTEIMASPAYFSNSRGVDQSKGRTIRG